MTDDEIMRQLSQGVRDDNVLAAEELTKVELWLWAGLADAVDPAS